jgi:hypothetical protein
MGAGYGILGEDHRRPRRNRLDSAGVVQAKPDTSSGGEAVLSTARLTWGGWAVLVLVISLACAALRGGARGTVPAGEGGPPPALLPTQGDRPDGFDGRRDTRHFVLL